MASDRAAFAKTLCNGPTTRVADARDHQRHLCNSGAGCPWRLLPSDLPPWGTIYRWFAAWRDDGCFKRINHALVMADSERVGRDASPTAAILDSQSAKTTEAGGPRGYDAGKKINGRKRHALVDTDGRGLVLEPHPASIQDRDGGGPLLRVSRRVFPFIQRIFADSGYAGEKVTTATSIAVEIVRKNPDQIGFAVGEIGDWQKTSRLPSTPHAPSSTPHPSCCLCVGSLVLHDFRNRLLVAGAQRQVIAGSPPQRRPSASQLRNFPSPKHSAAWMQGRR